MTSPERPPRAGDEGLRAAMDQVRGVRKPQQRSDAVDPATDATRAEPARRFWDVRGKLADDLARVPTPGAAAWPRPLAGLVAGLWAALMSWLVFAGVVLVGWVFAPLGSGGFADVMRASGGIWIIADGGVLQWQGATLSLTPLLATLVILLFQRRAGTWLVAAVDIFEPRAALVPLGYAVLASASAHALAVASVMNATLVVPLWRSMLGGAAVGAVGFAWGISRAIGVGVPSALTLTLRVMRRFVSGMAAAAVLAVLLLAVLQRGTFADVLGAVAGDGISTVQVLLLCAAYVPTTIGWAAAVLLGPGFSLGAGTAISVTGVHVGALPPVPLLALVPDSLPGSTAVLLLVPALIAVWATRGALAAPAWKSVVAGVGAGALVGALVGLTVAGGMGPGRLTLVGATWWQLASACAGWLLLGFGVHAGWAGVRNRLRGARKSDNVDAGKLQA